MSRPDNDWLILGGVALVMVLIVAWVLVLSWPVWKELL